MKLQKLDEGPTAKPSCCISSLQKYSCDFALGHSGCKAAGCLCKAWGNKHSQTGSISPSCALLKCSFCVAPVHVGVVYVVCLCILKAAPHKGGSMEPLLDSPYLVTV